ncbi:MAG: LPS export ABC transporter ATP-binding protein [Candidatus Aminicenantes bacterium]|nr:LPS export ABC transporter ATP-binding protein [Candidatus Aminicenantes bacterium]NIM77804.1 LPS export ABC transporter ATP-binding protein [Candidatus Aminicenantes bacterium]NIN17117.1 LPS export ABC transporter ATP-binding protein [Candidatus Aminicenantes bacterium]NIN41010.1 LPS export ABC transporter ATP-binding protein [Candidatus Aminicenantes bacterium]NIN83815.1 LPS export ABC transporter ATP-binding protein [Candidatus Aminicenantes bacterium]
MNNDYDFGRYLLESDVLETVELTKIYENIPVVNKISIRISSSHVIGLLGPNGAGKTTTFLMLSGIVKPDHGRVLLNGEDINYLPSHLRAERGLVYLPQQHSVFLKASVYKNLYMVLQLYYDKKTADQKALELLDDFGLLSIKDSTAYQLSGGEKRRLEIARAMVMKPKFLFLDEPFTGIDPITIIEIQKIILKLRERGIGVIVTDHNVKDTFDITDKVYIIQKGRLLSSGHPSQVVKEEQTRLLFLGDDFEWKIRPAAR